MKASTIKLKELVQAYEGGGVFSDKESTIYFSRNDIHGFISELIQQLIPFTVSYNNDYVVVKIVKS